jgi:hypothetical protein
MKSKLTTSLGTLGIVLSSVCPAGPSAAQFITSPSTSGKTILTVPAVASIHGVNGTSFRSDLWLLNRSYSSAANATLTYRCFGGGNCGAVERSVGLAARQSVLLEDVVGTLLGAPGTAGALEIAFDSGSGPVTATSRVYTSSASGTVGTEVSALPATTPRLRSVFVGLAASGGDLSKGFRSNAGAYNPNAAPATVTFTLYGETGATLGSTAHTLGALEAAQLYPNIFTLVGAGSVETRNAVLVATSTAPVFSYVTVIDNQSGDSVFLSSDQDEANPGSIAGVWTGTYNWTHVLGVPPVCGPTVTSPAQASFEQTGPAVVGVVTANDRCGIGQLTFGGSLEGNALMGEFTDDDGYRFVASGTLSSSTLEILVDNGAGYVFGHLLLHR